MKKAAMLVMLIVAVLMLLCGTASASAQAEQVTIWNSEEVPISFALRFEKNPRWVPHLLGPGETRIYSLYGERTISIRIQSAVPGPPMDAVKAREVISLLEAGGRYQIYWNRQQGLWSVGPMPDANDTPTF